jgi:hypothetical protein
MLSNSLRFMHTSRVLLQELLTINALPKSMGKGKKKPPAKQNLVILDAKESKLYKKKRPQKSRNPMMMLDDQEKFKIQEASKLLDMTTSTSVTQQELVDNFSTLKPTNTAISKQRFLQLTEDLKNGYTMDQIRKYINAEYPKVPIPHKYTKKKLIHAVIQKCWMCKISEDINPQDDLIQTKAFHLTKKQMFLLMSRSSIVQNWLRANVRIVLFPGSLQLVISANEAHLQYVELALDSLFKSCKESMVDLGKVDELFAQTGESLPLGDIQRMSGVFFEEQDSELDGEHLYMMSSLGEDKFSQAKRLILWSLDYNPFTKVNMHIDYDSKSAKFFRTQPDQSLPWIHRKKPWFRLREPKRPGLILPEIKIDSAKIFEELNGSPSTVLPQIKDTQAVTAVAFGQILQSSTDPSDPKKKAILNTDIPFIHEKILKLPLFGSEDENIDRTVDNHSYYAQIKFLPSPFNKTDNYLKYPPLEFWFDIDEREHVKKDSLQVLCITNDQNSNVSIPQASTDLKFVKSEMVDLADAYANDEEWLIDQPGIKEFLEQARLIFNGVESIHVPEYVAVKLPGVEEPIRYDYVTMCHRRQLDLQYKGRLITYAALEGGTLGGSTSEVIMVGRENEMEEEGFQNLVNDAISFVKELEI